MKLPADKMPEAEVSLRLAFWLLEHGVKSQTVSVAIDGAQVRSRIGTVFEIEAFLEGAGWRKADRAERWSGEYEGPGGSRLAIHSRSGEGDVVAQLPSGITLRAECKKGTLHRSKSSSEYPLVREALGQILTMADAKPADVLVVAVPSSEKFEELVSEWRSRCLVKATRIQIATIHREHGVRGLTLPHM